MNARDQLTRLLAEADVQVNGPRVRDCAELDDFFFRVTRASAGDRLRLTRRLALKG